MKTSARITILLTALIALIIAGCQAASTQAPATDSPTETTSGYPEVESSENGYPSSINREIFEQNLTPVAPDPEFGSDTGALKIQMAYASSDRPVRGQLFFAATMLPVQGVEEAFIPALDTVNDPSGTTDAQGVLVISNLAPGYYALSLMTPQGPILVEGEEIEDTILFDIVAGELTDLGLVTVLLNPEPLEP